MTQQILLQPAEILDDGTVARPAIYKTETRQQIVQERKETWFETPCASDLTPEFTASVQRALKARGVYRGPITSVMDARTRAAVRAYQKPQGLESGILSLAAARQLGLVAVEDSDTS
ncbi:peptidoglycan-binding domain-containing protein [Roseovarius rhodophyticola]|uniref:Peptidoglycan-binding domain-containing protein n=1 Tax=Roseovarius rhodophyticola TaxID=3080827 RepID=A0ABZ2TFI6_9RHOB|nr:peptidoglycan-binding domain-containing protein [Roseovarius sp. W115]MDV2928758.1 peptidoglycan-binding domain-containing protein [Roseovarius sp. W115]